MYHITYFRQDINYMIGDKKLRCNGVVNPILHFNSPLAFFLVI